jgi:hypothetical protein
MMGRVSKFVSKMLAKILDECATQKVASGQASLCLL